jgi:ABC-2 type transport system permease protein
MTPEFISAGEESRAFGRMRSRILATLLRQTFSRKLVRAVLVVVLTSILWGGMFWLSYTYGFDVLQKKVAQPEINTRIVGAIFGTFFAALFLMLTFTSAIILYSSLFRTREIAYLLTVPSRTSHVFLHKLQESVVLSSWGFLLLGSPMLVSYGVAFHAPWYYYAMLLPALAAFVYIPVALGAIALLWIVHRVPHKLRTALVGGAMLLGLAAVWVVWSLILAPQFQNLTAGWFQEVLGRMRFVEHRLLPSWWLTSCLLDAAAGVWKESAWFLSLLITNALLLRLLAILSANRVYRSSYSALYGMTQRRRRAPSVNIDGALSWAIGFLPVAVRLMIVKDWRLFRRDPLQWAQFLIFFGLLLLYFTNIRRLFSDETFASMVGMISLLNFLVVGLLLSTFTTRFIFPMVSLEGRLFWSLGLMPIRRDTILWSKFFFAIGCSILPCNGLILLSDIMLGVSPLVIGSHQLTCLMLNPGLAGIAVGLGACMPNLRDQSSSRIAAGFGGTLNLIISTLYIMLVMLLAALPIHFYMAAEYGMAVQSTDAPDIRLMWLWWVLGSGASLLLGIIATFVPMFFGIRAFRRMEF